MKKSLMLTIPVLVLVLTLAIVNTAHAYYAIASCKRKTLEVTAMGMSGSWGLNYGLAGAVAEVDDFIGDYESFNTEAVSCYAYDYGPFYESGYASGTVSGVDELTGRYRSMDDRDWA